MNNDNSNISLTLSNEATYQGLAVQHQFKPLIIEYLDGIWDTIGFAVTHHHESYAVRVDLNFPEGRRYDTNVVITKFFASLKAQIENNIIARRRGGVRVHDCKLRYVWVREKNSSVNHHFHVLLFLNKQTYNTIGNINHDQGNMSARIRKAWASALGCSYEEAKKGVHFPKNRNYFLNYKLPTFPQEVAALIYRASYMAKLYSKDFTDGKRNFGRSQN